MVVEMTDDRIVSALKVYRGCILEMFCERFLIDLAPIPLIKMMMVISMDWLSRYGVMIM